MEGTGTDVLKTTATTSGGPSPAPSVISKEFAQPSLFLTAWNLLNNIREDLAEPVALIRTTTPTGCSGFVNAEEQKHAFNSDSGNGNYPTIESYASTLPNEIEITAPKENPVKPRSPLPEVFSSEVSMSKTRLEQNVPESRSRSLPQKLSSTTAAAAAERKSSSGINCLLNENEKPPGTHRSNQAHSSALEYQELLDKAQSHYPFVPENSEKKKSKGLHGTRSFARLSDLYPDNSSGVHSIRISDGQLYASEDNSKTHGSNRVPTRTDNYLETVNDQLFRMNHERIRRQMAGLASANHNLHVPGNWNNSSGLHTDYGINQNNNVNINLTLAVSQVQQGGQFEVSLGAAQVDTEMKELKAPRPRPVHIEARVRSPKVETSMQTELGVQGDAEGSNATSEAPSRTPSTMKGTVQFGPEEFQADESTSAFPSAIPSAQSWKRRQPQPIPDINGPQDSWSNCIDLPGALTYTNESLKTLIETADDIINTCIIPPDDNPMSQEEMNADEDKVAISVMRLLGIPQQVRHSIYKETLHNLTAIKELSDGTVGFLSNLVDWLSDGNSGGKEEILGKVRILASITTDMDPESEVWTQFEQDIGIFTEAVGEVMKDGYEVGKDAVRKCSETLIQRLNASSVTSISQPVAVPLSCNPASRRESLRHLPVHAISEEERNSTVSQTPPKSTSSKIRSTSLGRQVGPIRCRASSPASVSMSSRISKRSQGRDRYRKDPFGALDVEIMKLSMLREDLQSRTTLSSVNTPAHPDTNNVDVCGNYTDSVQSDDEESVVSTEEPAYPNVKLLDGDSEQGYYATAGANQANLSLMDDAEKRQLLRQCRNDAHRLTQDINNRRTVTAGSSSVGFSRLPSRQHSEEESEVLPEYYPRRIADALMEAPPGYNFGIGVAINSACESIKSSIISQAESAVRYFPIFQGTTPILGQSRSESRDERVEVQEYHERYISDWADHSRLMGTTSRPRFATEDYFDGASDSGIPEPTSPAPPPIPRRQSQYSEVNMDDIPPSVPESCVSTEQQLDPEEQELTSSSLSTKDDVEGHSPTGGSLLSEISSCSTPQRPLLSSSSLLMEHGPFIPPAVVDAAAELSDLLNKLKPHWPRPDSAFSTEEQAQIAMRDFISAHSQKVVQFIASTTERPSDAPNSNEPADSGSTEPNEAVVELETPSPPTPTSEISLAEPVAAPIIEENGNLPEMTEDVIEESREETQLQKELNQLEKIVQDMCSEVTVTKLEPSVRVEPCLALIPANPRPPSWSRIPTPNRVKTPFALPCRGRESATTIDIYSPKPPMSTASCLSVDSSLLTRPATANLSPYAQSNSIRNSNRHSAFGRTIGSSNNSPSKLRQASVNSNQQRSVQTKKPGVLPQKKQVYNPGKLTSKSNGNKFNSPASSRPAQTYSGQSSKLSNPPSRETSKTALVSRTNSYRQLYQMKQTLVAKTAGPIHLRRIGTQQNPETQRGVTAGYGCSRSRGRTPLVPNERDRSIGRAETAPASAMRPVTTNFGMGSTDNNGGGYLSAHGSRSRLNIQTNVDSNGTSLVGSMAGSSVRSGSDVSSTENQH